MAEKINAEAAEGSRSGEDRLIRSALQHGKGRAALARTAEGGCPQTSYLVRYQSVIERLSSGPVCG